jgi:hypothetical protein
VSPVKSPPGPTSPALRAGPLDQLPRQRPIDRRRANGNGGLEALRVLKRRLSDVVYRALVADLIPNGAALT